VLSLLAASWALGLLGSLHCVAMCGGIVSMLSAGIAADLRKRAPVHVAYVLAYNVGRVASYAALGAVAGSVALGLRSSVEQAQLALRVLAGLVALAFGLELAGLGRGLIGLERMGGLVWKRVAPVAARLLPVRSGGHAVLLGVLWGLMPCGMVYAALAVATAAGGPGEASLVMAAFGMGTVPAMALSGTVAGHVMASAGRRGVRRAAGLLVAGLATMSIALAFAGPGSAHAHGSTCTTLH
jgi:sulfite exporter TauE/SafE